MLDTKEVDRIVAAMLHSVLADRVTDVHSVDSVDWEGHDALRVTVVLKDDALDGMEEDAILNALYRVQQDLQLSGEDRFAHLRWTTAKELAEEGLEDDDEYDGPES